MQKYKELFFWKTFINSIRVVNNANDGMIIEENDF